MMDLGVSGLGGRASGCFSASSNLEHPSNHAGESYSVCSAGASSPPSMTAIMYTEAVLPERGINPEVISADGLHNGFTQLIGQCCLSGRKNT